ncbi:WXG100 family type VII secretion target [Mycolicibacterium sp. 120270]|uniref:WXG100 family type VII secretion target n=1 Tax=Mycolicibacterium sp. 120270 TaxID=3090600 RepID=UPI00299DE412|nr:WXG100 family type VII secretion target [Mycolicibacterium sp. 120270]MDX1883189.1 WXG100 family type VII secretion target [Mycolicibacterium sp. 120270]
MVDIRVDVSRTLEASRGVGSDAEELRTELIRLAGEWDAVISGWSGAAAAAYAAHWEEWQDGATKLVESLTRSTQLLEQAAAAYAEQEGASAAAVSSVRGR